MSFIDDRAVRGLRDFVAGVGPGDVVDDRFELRQRIGEGGMGTVYAAVDRATDADVAVKIVGTYGDHDAARFEREVAALASTSHPALVGYVAHGVYAGERYVVMERLSGCTLAEQLTLGPLVLADAVRLARRVAGALAAVHAAGITHRDIKPSNVVLVGESASAARVVDFGLARPRGATALTRTGALIGTPGYMAPEQVRGDREVGPPADVFAFGCVLWECVTGQALFSAETEEKLLARILLEETPRMSNIVTGAPRALDGLVARMLDKDPSERPAATEIVAELDAIEIDDAPPGETLATGIVRGDEIGGKYRVESLLGAGGMGVVVGARHLELGTRVAIKLLRESDSADRARFLREARAASRLESEHVARVLDVGRMEDGRPYMVMEHLSGADLGRCLADRGRLAVQTAVGYVLEAAEALAEAHRIGIVHRDLKPSNLFLVVRRDGSEMVKVLDFGISKVTEPGGDVSRPATMTDTKIIMGSIPYMSPEQLRASSDVDVRTDIWALGVVLYELVAGRRPFEGDNAAAVAARIAASEPTSLRATRPEVPRRFEDVILKCLEKDRARRYPDLAVLAGELAPFAPSGAQASVERVARLLGAPSAARTPRPRPRPSAARHAVIGAALAALGGVAFFAWSRAPQSATETTPSALAPPEVLSVKSVVVAPAPSALEAPSATAIAVAPPPEVRALPVAVSAPAKPAPRPSSTGRPASGVPTAKKGELDLRDPSLESR